MEKGTQSTKKENIKTNLSSTASREFSAGGIVFKRDNSKVLWLITKSTPSDMYPISYWRLPKGWLDDSGDGKPGDLAAGKIKATQVNVKSAALREVREEGGVNAKIIRKISTEKLFYTRQGQKTLKFVTYFLMEYTADSSGGPGFETSKTGWFEYEDAKERLKYPSEKKVLEKAMNILKEGFQQNLV